MNFTNFDNNSQCDKNNTIEFCSTVYNLNINYFDWDKVQIKRFTLDLTKACLSPQDALSL